MDKNICVLIPVYNEGEVIRQVLSDVLKEYSNVICIDDGSRDNSQSEIKKTNAKLIVHPINLGQGAALQTGIDYALQDPKVEFFATFDADGQHELKDIKKLLDTLKSKKLDIALGSRFLGRAENMPWSKKVTLKMAIQFSNRTTGLKLTDTYNGMRVFNRKFAENLNIQGYDFTHAAEIIEKIALGNYKYAEVPVTIRYTEYSKSKGMPILNAINLGLDTLLNRISK